MEPPLAAPPSAALDPGAVAFSAGRVIGRSFSVWLRNFVPFSIVTLVVHLPVLALAAAMPPGGGPGWNAADNLLSGLARLVAIGALAYGVLESLHGERPSIGALFRTGFRKLGSVFAVSFRVGLWLLLGVVLLVVPALVWYCALFVAVPAIVVENERDSAEALQRSRDLTRGHRWAILAVVLVMFVVSVAGVLLAGALSVALRSLPQPAPTLAAVAVIALASTVGACAPAVAYHDLRLAKEGVSTADLVKVFE